MLPNMDVDSLEIVAACFVYATRRAGSRNSRIGSVRRKLPGQAN